MKKLTVLLVVIMALLFTGCCPTCPDCICPECPDCVCPVCPDIPECPDCICPCIPEPPEEKIITITWFEDAIRYHANGDELQRWAGDENGPATLIWDNGGYYFEDIQEYFHPTDIEFEGNVVITETGFLYGDATYVLYGLDTENIFMGQVEMVVYEDGISGTMVGTYTQFKYAYGTEEAVLLKYSEAVKCDDVEGKWFVQYTDYVAYPR